MHLSYLDLCSKLETFSRTRNLYLLEPVVVCPVSNNLHNGCRGVRPNKALFYFPQVASLSKRP